MNDKFWKWMQEKKYWEVVECEFGYGVHICDEVLRCPTCQGCKDNISKQMLIGYMIEYLIEIKAPFQIHWKIKYITPIYDYLKGIIERESK